MVNEFNKYVHPVQMEIDNLNRARYNAIANNDEELVNEILEKLKKIYTSFPVFISNTDWHRLSLDDRIKFTEKKLDESKIIGRKNHVNQWKKRYDELLKQKVRNIPEPVSLSQEQYLEFKKSNRNEFRSDLRVKYDTVVSTLNDLYKTTNKTLKAHIIAIKDSINYSIDLLGSEIVNEEELEMVLDSLSKDCFLGDAVSYYKQLIVRKYYYYQNEKKEEKDISSTAYGIIKETIYAMNDFAAPSKYVMNKPEQVKGYARGTAHLIEDENVAKEIIEYLKDVDNSYLDYFIPEFVRALSKKFGQDFSSTIIDKEQEQAVYRLVEQKDKELADYEKNVRDSYGKSDYLEKLETFDEMCQEYWDTIKRISKKCILSKELLIKKDQELFAKSAQILALMKKASNVR